MFFYEGTPLMLPARGAAPPGPRCHWIEGCEGDSSTVGMLHEPRLLDAEHPHEPFGTTLHPVCSESRLGQTETDLLRRREGA